MSKRVLLISYTFPPTGGAGVQRVTKFVKYLGQFGWSPSVLTVANPSVPLNDDSLGADVPQETLVRRAGTWEPGYALKSAVSAGDGQAARRGGIIQRWTKGTLRRLATMLLQPDPQVLWMPGAVREGMRLLREVPHDAIVATGPPFSTFLIGASLSRRTGLPLVLDYRDEWDLSSAYWENKRLDPLSSLVQRRMQRRVLRAAKVVLATTRCSAEALEQARKSAGSTARVSWIYNGFDPDDFTSTTAKQDTDRRPYRLAYTGTLWTLTTSAPLVEAVIRLAQHKPTLAAELELIFAGRRTTTENQILARLKGLPCRMREEPYLNHSAAVDLLLSSDGLCAILADLPGAGRVVPAKIFEYMAAKRPILGIAPRGEMWDLLAGHPAAHLFVPADIDGITAWLAGEIDRHLQGTAVELSAWDASQYDRKAQAGQLAEILESVQ
jgi:glycosyltransferase involved in cell wall biosynthesis